MPVQSRKNPNSKDKVYSDFRGGGLNLGASERFLSEKEVAGGKNFCYERNGGRFRTLEPLELVATAAGTVTSLYWSLNFGMIFSCGRLYIVSWTARPSVSAPSPALICRSTAIGARRRRGGCSSPPARYPMV